MLEHVYDLDAIATQIAGRVRANDAMLYILPCDNEGSFEQQVCKLHRNGTDPGLGCRFFFEDEGHLRRLTTRELVELFQPGGFRLERAYYRNQYHGAVEWITASGSSFVGKFADDTNAIHPTARVRLRQLRFQLMWLAYLRSPLKTIVIYSSSSRRKRFLVLPLLIPFYPIAKWLERRLKHRADPEWQFHRRERNGSEMYLYFRPG